MSVVAVPQRRADHAFTDPAFLADLADLLDLGLIVFAAALAKWIYVDLIIVDHRETAEYVVVGLLCAAIASVLLKNFSCRTRLHFSDRRLRPLRLLVVLASAFLIVVAIGFLAKVSSAFSRGWLLLWFSAAYLFLLLSRAAFIGLLDHLARVGALVPRTAIVALPDVALRMLSALPEDQRIAVAGPYLPPHSPPGLDGRPFHQLLDWARTNELDDIYVADDGSEATRKIVEELRALPVGVSLITARYSFEVPARGITSFGGIPALQVAARPITPWGRLAKRTVDLVVASLALMLTSPLFALIAAAIALDSRGPVLFRQRRHGHKQQIIEVLKFRTMHVLEDGNEVRQATRGDERITRVGRVLRSLSLDELPQLINVLRGEMSLVGPRPHAIAHDEQYAREIENYMQRLRMQPGMTGWAQIHGLRGPTPDPRHMAERVRMDLDYIERWSIWLDLKILLLTPIYGFHHRNAV